ncbi:MAG TPA: hypothetical protein VFJ76_06135 [Solirubrobacterales bacterium]|nr:hypothetical protein [Solirubrobacterales bacterium]
MRRLCLAGAVLVALLLPSSSALAAPHHPTGEFAQFDDCPLSNPAVTVCLFSESSSGFFTIGKKTVPLKNPVKLQGGLDEILFPTKFYPAEDGNSLPGVPQPVPGGLLGITAPSWWPWFLQNLFNETINNGFTGVTATVEATSQTGIEVHPFNLLTQSGTALSLPAKIKLSNPFLGSNCYIGSNSNPVVLAFTTGTTSPPPPNTPITGSPGTLTQNPTETIGTFSGGKLVNNSFAAPGANGCGGLFSFLVDPFVNEIVGVPSAAGRNTAILEGKIQVADSAAVKASE